MSAKILDGKWVREQILAELRPRIEKLTASHRQPGLAVILVGHDPASEIYVRNKIKTCGDLGIYSEKIEPPATINAKKLTESWCSPRCRSRWTSAGFFWVCSRTKMWTGFIR
jgi:methylenetetrahydrofolate dehydrogenase (NADP+)/methenyltetrahydrofolate cyclohydrolase